MPNSLQAFLSTATPKAAEELTAAFLRLSEDKRNWSPDEKARTALDQVAECAILNGYTAELVQSRQWTMTDFNVFIQAKADLVAQGWESVQALLQENTPKVVAAIGAVPEEDLSVEIPTPLGSMLLSQIVAYPYWNMTYHTGQINYIASILGCLD
jgi:hypothetical protein